VEQSSGVEQPQSIGSRGSGGDDDPITRFDTECSSYDGGVEDVPSGVCCTDSPLFVVPPTPRAHNDSSLWNAMISPLTKTVIKGVVWFQGEGDSSVQGGINYNCTFPGMIAEWRRAWHAGTGGLTEANFPFGFLQLGPVGCQCPALRSPNDVCNCPPSSIDVGWGLVRWSQTASYGCVCAHCPRAPCNTVQCSTVQ
jgi:hypothetical protein